VAELVDLGRQAVARGFTAAECERLFPAGGCPSATAPIRRDLQTAGGTTAYASFVGGDAALTGTRVVITGQFDGPAIEAFAQAAAAIGDELGVEVVYRSAFLPGGPQAVAVSDDPGDIVLVSQPGVIDEIAGERAIVDVGSYIGEQYLRDSYGDYLTSLASLNGTSYGVFMKVDAKSLIWYNSAVFAGEGYAEPFAWVDLLALSDRMVLDGRTPWCLGVLGDGWIATDWFESIVLRSEGADFYDKWVAHEIPFDHPALIEALEKLGALSHTPGYVSPDPGHIDDRPLDEAVFLATQEDPQCLMLPVPAWGPAFFPPDVPMVAMPFPSIDPAYVSSMVGGGDVAIALSDRPEVRAVMRGLASPEYGALWAESGNPFIAPHREFDMSVYTDPVAHSIAATVRDAIETGLYRYDAADLMPDEIGLGQLVTALVNYLADPNASAQEALSTVEASWVEYEANSTGG
jgi:alpha-glucoside transport system substrate-binding protein